MRSMLPRLLSHMPTVVKRELLVLLFRATAAAFGRNMPRLRGMSRDECLLQYARFTADQTAEVLHAGDDLAGLQERLYRNAYRLGRVPGRLLGLNSIDAVMGLGRFLYSLLDIELEGDDCGEIVISRCYFSRFYSPEVCRVMSAMDRGLFAGLAGGGELVFSARITEGQACCRAHFASASNRSSARRLKERGRT